jgi:hypothetical protein
MRVVVVALIACVVLGSCYTPNQARFSSFVNGRVEVGMPVSSAIAVLTADGFACSGNMPTDCSRIQQRLLPSSCVERVRLYSELNSRAVGRVEVPPIACTGL